MEGASKGASRLCDYDLSDDSDEEKSTPLGRGVSSKGTKREVPDQWLGEVSKKRACYNSKNMKLPVPSILTTMFPASKNDVKDDPIHHEGRIRSFPHQRGNWATYIFIPFEKGPAYESFVDVVITSCQDIVPLNIVNEPHISLTRTLVLQHHWLDSFSQSVRESMHTFPSFYLDFSSLHVYCNEEKTRTFLALTVLTGRHLLQDIVDTLNKTLDEFKLPHFYQNSLFHLSVAWCVGDQEEKIAHLMPQLDIVVKQFIHVHPDEWSINVEQLMCKMGNKKCAFKLLPVHGQ